MKIRISRYFLSFFMMFLTLSLRAVAPNTVIATIGVGDNPAGIAVTPDSQFVYVANSGDNTVDVISVATNEVIDIISGSNINTPYSVTINPAGTLVYVTNSGQGAGENEIKVIDVATNTIVTTITGFDGPDGVAITPDGAFAYVANYGFPSIPMAGTTVDVVNLSNNTIVRSITTGGTYVAAVAVRPDGKFVYAANYNTGTPNDGTISVIDTSSNTVVATINGFFGPYTIAITPDSAFAYVTNFGSNNFMPIGTFVSVVDLSTNTIIDTIPVGNQSAGIALTPDGSLLYATNYNDTNGIAGPGTVNIINQSANAVISPVITVGQGPGAIAITPNGQYAYVSNYLTNTVSVIALQSFQIVLQGCRTQNVFLTQIDLINKLTWSATGGSLPVSYTLYSDAGLTSPITTVSAADPLIYLDHNKQPGVLYTYYLVGTNAIGTTSYPVSITVTQNC